MLAVFSKQCGETHPVCGSKKRRDVDIQLDEVGAKRTQLPDPSRNALVSSYRYSVWVCNSVELSS